MANVKISELTQLTNPVSSDVLPIVDSAVNTTKKISIADLLKNASAGSAAAPGIAFDDDSNTGLYSPGADQVAISTNGTGKVFIDASGNVAIGAATYSKALTINNVNAAIALRASSGGAYSDQGIFFVVDGTNYSQIYNDGAGQLIFRTSSGLSERLRITSTGALNFTGAGTAGVTQAVSFNGSAPVNSLVIDSSGRLLVGTSSTSAAASIILQGNSSDSTAQAVIRLCRGTNTPADGAALGAIGFGDNGHASNFGSGATILAARDGGTWTQNVSQPSRLVFSTTADGASSPTERMRISANGLTRTYSDGDSIIAATGQAAGTTFGVFVGRHSATSTTTGTNSFIVFTNGNVVNTNNSYGAISDIKLKENIVDANSQWDDIKALQVRNYNFKEGQTHTQIGLIAQEVELVSPGLVSESPDSDAEGNDLGTVTKSVNYSVLYMKAVKALQEAMERIETLEDKVAALESA